MPEEYYRCIILSLYIDAVNDVIPMGYGVGKVF